MEIQVKDQLPIVIDENELAKSIQDYDEIAADLASKLGCANIVGAYAELLVAHKLGLVLENKSNKDYDAESPDGKKYQIKSRWIKKGLGNSGQNEFGPLKYCEAGSYPFHVLVLVVFNGDLLNPLIYQIRSESINGLLGDKGEAKPAHLRDGKVVFKCSKSFLAEASRNDGLIGKL